MSRAGGPAGLSALDLFLLAAYLAAVAWAGYRAARRRCPGEEDFLLAGRGLTAPAFVATLVPSFYGGTLGVGEYTYRFGVSNWLVQGVPYYAFSLLYAWLLAGRVRVSPGRSLADHVEAAYGKPAAVLTALLVFLIASPADELLMVGTLTRWATGWPLAACLALSLAVCLPFLLRGGLRSDVWANRVEFVLMFCGFALILPAALSAAGGLGGLAAALPAGHLDPTGGKPPLELASWFFIALWTFVDPAFHQRVLAARDPATARRGILACVPFWLLFDAMTTTAGLCARAQLPGLAEPLEAYPALAERLLPAGLKGLFLAGLASSTLAALGTTSFLAASNLGRDAAGRLWPADEAASEKRVGLSLVLTGALALGLALWLPSVVGLWYAVGSVAVPGLLLPLLGCYFEPLRLPRGAAPWCSAAGSGAALAALLAGWQAPLYAGLGTTIIVWGASNLVSAGYPRSLFRMGRRG